VTAFVSAPMYVVSSPWEEWRHQAVPPKKRVDFDANIKTLVVVAGVSGSGKSTFIQQLLTASLSDDIASRLPQDIKRWSFVGEKIPRAHRLLGSPSERPDGQIIHYEITQAYKPRPDGECLPPAPDDYWACEDIAFMRKISAAEQVYLVVVEAPGERVASQLSNRSLLLHIPTVLRPLFVRCGGRLQAMEERLPSWISGKASRVLGRRWRHRSMLRERNIRLIELYRRPNALEEIYREWPRTLQEAWGKRMVGEALRVTPAADDSGRASFTLYEPTPN